MGTAVAFAGETLPKVVTRLGIEPRTYGLRDCQGGAGGRVLRLKKLRMKAGWGGAGEGVSFYSVL